MYSSWGKAGQDIFHAGTQGELAYRETAPLPKYVHKLIKGKTDQGQDSITW